MKKIVLLLLFVATSLFAQEKKYQSLLWEISGNGLAKNSYLYGSMHVSDKVSYHLSDAFFNHLLGADIVAGESDPATWSALSGMLSADNTYMGSFYSQFYLFPLQKESLTTLFQSNNYTLNSLLFRTNEQKQEHQEETYLDMFIYRTGKKYNKVTIGLEDAKTSVQGIMSIDPNTIKPIEGNRAALQKILKNISYQEALRNYYRDKDLDMIDSINVLMAPDHYLKALLYDRNIVMVRSIDSLARKGSLFAAVGAAHLPGKKGIIEALRKKGYVVTPVFDSYTEKGIGQKQQIEAYFSRPVYKRYTSPDGMLSLPLFTSVTENENSIESPDLSNGGYISISRTLLSDYLKKDNKPFDHRSLDSLFYENIQGKILEKKQFIKDGYTAYDIKSVTKTGNAQRYNYYITPLEIITIIMSGEGNYVRQFENDVFNSITLKPAGTEWANASPKHGGFSVSLPAGSIIYEEAGTVASANTEMYGYDSKEQGNYFVLERTLTDNDNLEDSRFELQRIHFEFYNQLDIDSTATKFKANPLRFTSSSKIGNKDIRLQSLVKGSKYYLLGSVGATESSTEKFFNSFEIKPGDFTEDFRTYTDSIGSYSIQIPKKQNEKLDFVTIKTKVKSDDKINVFQNRYNGKAFKLPSGQEISLTYYKPFRYHPKKYTDSIWNSIRKSVTGEYEDTYVNDYDDDAGYNVPMAGKRGVSGSVWNEMIKNSLKGKNKASIIKEETIINKEKNFQQLDFLTVKDNSEQAIKHRFIYKNGIIYQLNVLVDKNYNGNNLQIEKVFDSFTFFEGEIQPSLNDDKVALFMEDAKSEHDSIRFSALASVYSIPFENSDAKRLIGFMETFEFKADETSTLLNLYSFLGNLKDEAIIPFLDKKYREENVNAITQFSILEALASQKSKEAYKKIMELMEYDLPISDNQYSISSLFEDFKRDAENSKVLFPDVFQFYSIKEYHDPIISFTAALLDDKTISPKKLKSYKKMILTNAKLELKRVKSRKADGELEEVVVTDDYYSGITDLNGLTGFIDLLYPFRSEKDIRPFFTAIKTLNLKDINLEMARLDIINNNQDKTGILPLLEDPETLFTVYTIEQDKKDDSLIKDIPDETIAASAVFTLNSLSTKNDSLTFMEKRTVQHYEHKVTFYFFTLKDISEAEYGSKPDRIAAVAFINDENGRINPHAFKYISPQKLDEDKPGLNIKWMIDSTLNEGKIRVSFGNMQKYNELMYDGYNESYD